MSESAPSTAAAILQLIADNPRPASLCRKLRLLRQVSPSAPEAAPDASLAPLYEPLHHLSKTQAIYNLATCFLLEHSPSGYLAESASNHFFIIVDSGASISITPHRDDFIGPIHPVQQVPLKGIAGSCHVEGIGTVRYSIPRPNQDDFLLTIHDVLYVPSCPSRLICPRQLHAQSATRGFSDSSFTTNSTSATLVHEGATLTFLYHERSQLPLIEARSPSTALPSTPPDIAVVYPSDQCSFTSTPSSDPASPAPASTAPSMEPPSASAVCPSNLTAAQRFLLEWHYRLGHQDMQVIQTMIRKGTIPAPASHGPVHRLPRCEACLRGKAKSRSHKRHKGTIGAAHAAPGLGVSVDHVEAGHPGFLWQSKGAPTPRRYKYFSMYVDHHSRFLFPYFQETKSALETLKGKHAFEAFARARGVQIQHIHTDNGVFASDAFTKDVDRQHQTISFSGVNAHWHNGIIERFNGVIVQAARTMLLHATARWPGMITPEFWPFAVQHAINVYNVTTSRSRGHAATPWEIFTGSDSPWQVTDFKTLFCPVYILDRRLQEGLHTGKWHSRSELGVYIGHSHQYAGVVPLVWNPRTRLVSPQFHVIFDEHFDTVSPSAPTSAAALADLHQRLFSTARWSYADEFPADLRYYFDTLWQQPASDHQAVSTNQTCSVPDSQHRAAHCETRSASQSASRGSSESPAVLSAQTQPVLASPPSSVSPPDSSEGAPSGAAIGHPAAHLSTIPAGLFTHEGAFDDHIPAHVLQPLQEILAPKFYQLSRTLCVLSCGRRNRRAYAGSDAQSVCHRAFY